MQQRVFLDHRLSDFCVSQFEGLDLVSVIQSTSLHYYCNRSFNKSQEVMSKDSVNDQLVDQKKKNEGGSNSLTASNGVSNFK